MASYPLLPKDEVGFRIQLTAANSDEQVDSLNSLLGALSERFQMQAERPALQVLGI